jgi:myo-inositol-1(or 4)-monophosphatase
MKQFDRYRNVAIKAAHIGGKILLKHFENISEYDLKKGAGIVTKADTESEKIISSFLRKQTPDFGIFAEEEGYKYKGDTRWIIDPLDGTTNFFHRVPHFNISIGLEMDKEIVVGVIYNPITGEMYNCSKGGGAYRNKERIHVSRTKKLSTAMLATGFAYMSEKKMEKALDLFLRFSLNCHGIRRFGAAALDCCYVAAGIYDGFYEKTLSPWDVAAGSLLVTEAGGKLSSYNGKKFSIYDKEIVASNGLIHNEMIKTIRG